MTVRIGDIIKIEYEYSNLDRDLGLDPREPLHCRVYDVTNTTVHFYQGDDSLTSWLYLEDLNKIHVSAGMTITHISKELIEKKLDTHKMI